MKKSAIAIILSLVFAVMCIAPFIYAAAADSKPFSLKVLSMKNGELRLSINAHNMPDLAACDFKLDYDSSVFTPKANNESEYWVIGADSKAAKSFSGDFYAEVNAEKAPMPVGLYFTKAIGTQDDYNVAKLDVDVADFELIILSFSYSTGFKEAKFSLSCDYNTASSDETFSASNALTVKEPVETTTAPEVTTKAPEAATKAPEAATKAPEVSVNDKLNIKVNENIKLIDNNTVVVISDKLTTDTLLKAAREGAVLLNADDTGVKGEALASGMKLTIKDGDKTVSKTIVVLGDVDGDSEVSSADARIALRTSVNLETLNSWQSLAANVDNQEGVLAADARLILRASVNLEKITDWLAAM